MVFTKSEWEILDNRLGVPDAIVQAMTDTHPDDPAAPFTEADVGAACHDVAQTGVLGIDYDYTPVQLAVLRDCCEGCTYFADIDDAVARGELTRGKALAMHRAAHSLEDKLNTFVTTY